jgi:hypothetical protein
VSLTGRLEEVSVPEVLHLLSWGEKTGKLTLNRAAAECVVVFRSGRIINAASNSPREVLGSILVCRKLVSEEALMTALEERHRSEVERSLGATLVAMGAITSQTLETTVRQRIEHVIAEFFLWDSGFFRFEPMEVGRPVKAAADCAECASDCGFHTEQVILEVVRRVDETRRRREEYAAGAGGPVPAGLMDDQLLPDPFVPPRNRPATVHAIVAEMQTPVLRGEAIFTILRHARGLVRRAVLFIQSHRGFVGSGQFGVEIGGGSADEHVRRLVMPLDQASVLADVAAKRGTYRGMLPLLFWNEFLVTQLGGAFPREVIVVPAIVDGSVVAMLYGDNIPSEAPIGPVSGLEAAMIEACARYVRPLLRESKRATEFSARAAARSGSARTAG